MTARNPLKRPGDLLLSEDEPEGSRQEEVKSKRPCLENGLRSEKALKQMVPFTHELLPLPSRPPGKRFSYEEAMRGTEEPVRVYADGVFDLFHSGHARVLMQAKTCFPNTHLIVGITSDELTHRLKGKTVLSEEERYDSVRHCRYVDEVLTNAPWTITEQFLDEHQIDFVAHDDLPYNSGGTDDIYQPLKEVGRFVATQRTPGISTSDIIARIVKDYDLYLTRNLARGYTVRDLNVGYIKEKELVWRERMSHLKHGMEEKSRDIVSGFMALFGRDGRISEFFSGQKERIKKVFSPDANGPGPSAHEADHPLGGQSSLEDDETTSNYNLASSQEEGSDLVGGASS